MRAAWFICLFLALAFVLDVHEAAPEPKRRGGGSRRGSSSSSSGSGGWFSSGNKNSNSGYPKQNYGQNNYGETITVEAIMAAERKKVEWVRR